MPDMLSFILKTFCSIFDVDANLNISYGNEDGDIIIKKGNLDFFNGNKAKPENFVWDSWRNQKIPFPFNTDKVEKVIAQKQRKVIIHYDVVAASFYFLSGWQEIYTHERDRFGRFPFKKSFQYKHNLILVPVVNYYFDILKKAIELKSGKSLKQKLWPDASLCVFLSHDIDKINSGWKEDAFFELKQKKLKTATRILGDHFRGKKSWNNLSYIIDLEKSLDVNSTFFFLTEKSNANADYNLHEVEYSFSHIKKAGSEIGIHGSFGTHSDDKKLGSQTEMIRSSVTGNRFHFLKYEQNLTPNVLDNVGLKYDASLGFAEHIGFRNSFCLPFFPYNSKTKSACRHLQIPLMIMDGTLYNTSYMGKKSYDENFPLILELIRQVSLFNGVLSILWHNTFFTHHKYAGWERRYIDLIKLLHSKNALFCTGNIISEQFKPSLKTAH